MDYEEGSRRGRPRRVKDRQSILTQPILAHREREEKGYIG
jgi:hypothetical protein